MKDKGSCHCGGIQCEVEAPENNIVVHTFNTGATQHMFCGICGIKPVYIPRSNPDGYNINARCLDSRPQSITFEQFDGQYWGSHAHKLA